MKQLLTLIVVITTITLSCKKDVIETTGDSVEPNYSHLTGNFLCNREYHMYYSSGGINYSDVVLNFEVTGNTLKVLLFEFVIESETQTQFTSTNAITGETTSLIFTNDFQNVTLNWDAPSYLGGPHYTTDYEGVRTTLIESNPFGSILPHPYKSEIEGQYIMTITQINTYTELNSSYIDTLPVTMTSDRAFDVGGSALVFGRFHSYFNDTSNDYTNDGQTVKRLLRTNGTLRLEYREVAGFSSTPTDSIVTIFDGVKL